MNKKKFFIQLALFITIVSGVFFLTLTGKRGEYINITGFTQGTTYHITYEQKHGEDFQKAIDSLLSDFDMSLSTYNPNSLLSRINRNEPDVRMDSKLRDVYQMSVEVNRKTEGAFDITVGPIVNALGFGSTDTMNVDSAMIDSLVAYIGMDKIYVKDNTIIKKDPHVIIDVNSIAQGYSVDIVSKFLEKHGIRNYIVEIGGEIHAKGRNKSNQFWRVGIDKPSEGNMIPGEELQAIIQLKNRSLSTAGNYRKFYEKNGIKYVHIINPKTGYPVISRLLSATVIARDCFTADAYDTALMVMGLERSILFLKKNSYLQAYLIYTDEKGIFRVYTTPGLNKYLTD